MLFYPFCGLIRPFLDTFTLLFKKVMRRFSLLMCLRGSTVALAPLQRIKLYSFIHRHVCLLINTHHALIGPDLSVPAGLVQVHLVALVPVDLQHGQQRRGEVAAGLVLDDLLQVSLVL